MVLFTVALGGTVDFVRLLGKDSSGLYALKVGEEHIGNSVSATYA